MQQGLALLKQQAAFSPAIWGWRAGPTWLFTVMDSFLGVHSVLHAAVCQLTSSVPTGPSCSKIPLRGAEVGGQATEKAGPVPSWQSSERDGLTRAATSGQSCRPHHPVPSCRLPSPRAPPCMLGWPWAGEGAEWQSQSLPWAVSLFSGREM